MDIGLISPWSWVPWTEHPVQANQKKTLQGSTGALQALAIFCLIQLRTEKPSLSHRQLESS